MGLPHALVSLYQPVTKPDLGQSGWRCRGRPKLGAKAPRRPKPVFPVLWLCGEQRNVKCDLDYPLS